MRNRKARARAATQDASSLIITAVAGLVALAAVALLAG